MCIHSYSKHIFRIEVLVAKFSSPADECECLASVAADEFIFSNIIIYDNERDHEKKCTRENEMASA